MFKKFLHGLAIITFLVASACGLSAQQPSTFNDPIFSANAKYVQGWTPSYAYDQSSSGLTFKMFGGTNFACGSLAYYSGGSLALTANSTNYVYLDTTASCIPAFNTTGFTLTSQSPLYIVTTGASNVTNISDVKTMFGVLSSGGATFTPNAVQYATSGSASRAATAADFGTIIFGTDSGSASAYAVAVTPAPTVTSDTTIAFLPIHNNTANPTLALNGGTAYPLVGDNNIQLQAGDLNVQTYARVQWNAFLTAWVLLNPTTSGRSVTNNTVSGAGADTFGDSVMYYGGNTTGCPTSGYQAGGVPTGGVGSYEVTCNDEPSLIISAYNGVGHAFPASSSNFSSGAYSNSTSLDVMDLQILPNTTPTDFGAPDYFIQMSEGDALVGGIGSQPQAYEAEVTAAAGWLGAPRRSQMWATDSACVQTSGTWVADNTFHSGVALTTSTNGAILTCTTPYSASTGVIAIWKVVNSGTASATFKIDGVNTATWSSGAAGTIGTTPGNTAGWWGAAYTLSTTPATHTFVITTTTTQPFTFVLFSMPQPQQIWLGLNYPRVFIGGPENYNSTTIAYDPYTQTAVNAVIATGFTNVKYVSLINAIPDEGGISWSGGTYGNGRVCPVSIAGGSPHPGNCGHLFESWAFLQAAGKTPNGAGVTSFNTRVGAVVPTTNDYSYSQVTNAAGLPAANNFTNTNTFISPTATAQAQIIKGTNGSYATPAVVHQTTQDSPTTSFTFSGVVAGDTLMSNCRINGGSGVYTDSQSQTINTTGSFSNPTFNELDNANSGTHTWTTGSTPTWCWFAEISGLNGVNQAYSSSFTTMPVVPTNALTTTTPTYLIAGVISHGATFGSGGCTITATSYTTIQNTDGNINVFGLAESSTGTYAANLNGTGTGCSNGSTYEYIVAFNLAVASGQTGGLVHYEDPSANVLSRITHAGQYQPIPVLFASLDTCTTGTTGTGTYGVYAAVSDSTTNTQGATITGGGSNKVAAWCNGTNWVVASGSGGSGSVTDGSGTTTPGKLAVSTSVAHVLQYITNNSVLITDPPYNAHCDGSTDDTTAIQAAINSGFTVNFPISTVSDLQQCNINSPLTGPSGGQTNLIIHGNGSELNYLGSSSTDALNFSSGPTNVFIDNLYINTQTLSTGNIGIEMPSSGAGVLQLMNDSICAGSGGCGSDAVAYQSIYAVAGTIITTNLNRDGTLVLGVAAGPDFLIDNNTFFWYPGGRGRCIRPSCGVTGYDPKFL